jgi:hypothetical protein
MNKTPFLDSVVALIIVLCVFGFTAFVADCSGDSDDLGISVPTETRSKK